MHRVYFAYESRKRDDIEVMPAWRLAFSYKYAKADPGFEVRGGGVGGVDIFENFDNQIKKKVLSHSAFDL